MPGPLDLGSAGGYPARAMVEDEIRGQLHAWREAPGTVAIFTDIDGTLAPIVPTPDISEVSDELKELLRQLSERYLLVAGISGRKTEDALDLVGLADVVYFGNHGFEILRDGEVEVTPEALPYLEKVQELEERAREELGPLGAFVEEKGITASIHYRNAPPEVGEARPPVRANKGTAVRTLVEEYRPARAMFIGDDTTDLDAFRELVALREEGELEEILRVGVASEEGPPEITAEADIVVDGVDGVGEVLRALLSED